MTAYVLQVVALIAMYSAAALMLDLTSGHMRMVSLCHGALFGVGAYCMAIAAARTHLGIEMILFMVIGAGALVGAAVGFVVQRSAAEEVVLVTLAAQLILGEWAINARRITGGSLGIAGIPELRISGVAPAVSMLVLPAVTLAIAVAVAIVMTSGRYGLIAHAIREQPRLVSSVGVRPEYWRVLAMTISGAVTAAAGGTWAIYTSYIEPSMFSLDLSLLLLTAVILGGAGSRMGPICGAILVVVIPEALRWWGIDSARAAEWRQVAFAAIVCVLLIYRPQGAFGSYDFAD